MCLDMDRNKSFESLSNRDIFIQKKSIAALFVCRQSHLEPGEVGEGAIGFGHAMHIFFFLHRDTGIVVGVD